MGITVYSLGAAEEVTGSKHIFEINGRPFMIDCGAFQGKRKVADEKNRNFQIAADKLEAVILTHGHLDHCGLLPVLARKGYTGNIYSTPATRDIANIVMMDSARIQAKDAEFLQKKASRRGEKFSWRPLFTEKDCVKTASQIVSMSYNRKMFIAPDVELEFFEAGHILGSAFANVTIKGLHGKFNAPHPGKFGENETRILFTGDMGRKNQPIIRDPATTEIPAPDYIFLESTYGNRKHDEKEFAMHELERVINETYARGGKIIIPSFAIERAQELVFYLHLLFDAKKIPNIPIYVDSPMATNATGVFKVHPECYDDATNDAFLKHHKNPFGFNSLTFTDSVEESKSLNDRKEPMIIISADGMCEAGRVLHHLANNVSDEKNTVLVVGYMAENTLGRKILDGEKDVKIMGDNYKVRSHVEQIDAFSAHADYDEMTTWLKSIDTSRLKQIFMVHGEKDSQAFFKNYLAENGFHNVTIVKYGETYDLV